jgi:hypothetical protein
MGGVEFQARRAPNIRRILIYPVMIPSWEPPHSPSSPFLWPFKYNIARRETPAVRYKLPKLIFVNICAAIDSKGEGKAEEKGKRERKTHSRVMGESTIIRGNGGTIGVDNERPASPFCRSSRFAGGIKFCELR